MNICIVSYIYPNPGDRRLGCYIEEQAIELAKHHNVHVITKGNEDWNEEEIVKGVKVHRVIANKLIFPLKCFVKLVNLNRETYFDVVHSHFTGILTIFCGIASRIIGKPFFVTAYGIGLDPSTASFFRKLSITLSFKFAKKIINISRYTRRLSEHYASKEKHIVITPGITLSKLKPTMDLKKFRKKWNLGKGVVLLSIGGLVWRKGFDITISILPDIIKQYPDLKYVIIGRGSQEANLKKLIKKYNLTKNVTLINRYIPDEELANFYNASDIFILMSRTKGVAVEGFGIVYVEANAAGKPVIGGKGGGTSDAVVDGKSGFLVEFDNTEKLKEKLFLLISNNKLRKRMGRYGKLNVKKNHLWEYKVKQLTKLYSEFV